MRARTMWLLVPLMAAALAMAGCSSSGGDSAASSGGASSGAAGSPIVIGTIGEYSGPLALPDARAGIQAWAAAVNASGGIDGHPVKLYVEDTAGNAATAVTEAKTLIDYDHVIALVGIADNNASTWAPYADSKGIPVVGGALSSAVIFMTDPNFFSVGGNILSSFYGVAVEARKLGSKTALVYCAETPTCHAAATVEQLLAKPLGLSLSYSAGVPASASDFTAQCQAMKDSGAASWTPGLAIPTAERLAAQCEQQGFTGKLIWPLGTSGSSSTSIPAFDGSEYVDSTIGFFVDSTPATQAFHAALAKYEPAVGTAALPLKGTGIAAWASGELLEAAIKASSDPDVTSESIKKGLYALKNDTLGGLVPPLNFKPGQVNLHNCYFTYSLEGGKYMEPDLQPTCVSASADVLIDKIAASLKS
jgi:branched-chain amino acid transport system substrate-binding protein